MAARFELTLQDVRQAARLGLFAAGAASLPERQSSGPSFGEQPAPNQPEQVASSYLGTPVFSNLEIQSGKYIDENGNPVNYEGISINHVLMSLELSKSIKETEVQGRVGTVKEYISPGDYRIGIQGYLFDETGGNSYPEEQVLQLDKLANVPAALKVNSRFLNRFGIYELVITSHRWKQEEGIVNAQKFELDAVQDRPFQLQLNEEA